jgi:oligopeptide transport system permease protein
MSSGSLQSGHRTRATRVVTALSGVALGLVAMLGAGAPWVSSTITGFTADEQHLQLAFAPPLSKDISLDKQAYDGDRSSFDSLDLDGDGYIRCERRAFPSLVIPGLRELEKLELSSPTPGGAATVYGLFIEELRAETAALSVPLEEILGYHLGELRCPELERAAKAWRYYEMFLNRFDVAWGDSAPGQGPSQPDGFVSRAEFPTQLSDLEPEVAKLVSAGDAGFSALDENGNGYIGQSELIANTRHLRFSAEQLLRNADADGDLAISRAEYPGAPALSTFWLGTDGKGRCLLTRLSYGARISLLIGVLATAVSLLIGLTWGAVAGFAGGRIDAVMMRFVDVLYGLPFMFLVILLIVFVGRNTVNLFIALGAVQWLTMSRVVRGQVLSLRSRPFVDAARAMGVSRFAILTRHILPNAMGPVLAYAALLVPAVIKEEAFLSFLGLGVQPPDPSWGSLIADGAQTMETAWWLVAYPAATLAITLFSLNYLADSALARIGGRR